MNSFQTLIIVVSRKEYQKDKGNVSHAHMTVQFLWHKMAQEERDLVNALIQASICDIL